MSLPTRERGLKYAWHFVGGINKRVAPYTGAWIEIKQSRFSSRRVAVAPYTGAWIEIL